MWCDHFLLLRGVILAEAGSGWLIRRRGGCVGIFLTEVENCSPVFRVLESHEGLEVSGEVGRGIAGGGGGHVLGARVVGEAGRDDEEGEGGADRPGVDVYLSVRPPQAPSQILLAERAG